MRLINDVYKVDPGMQLAGYSIVTSYDVLATAFSVLFDLI